MVFKKIFFVLTFMLIPFSIFAKNGMAKQINDIINSDKYAQSNWGILVKDLTTDKVLYSKNANKLFTPGSTAKLYSVGAALIALKPDFRYKTPIYITGNVDHMGVLHGNLILVASGDLTLGGRTQKDGTIAYTNFDHSDANAMQGAILTKTDPMAGLNDLSKQVAAYGIKRIDGEVIIDTRLFEKDTDTSADHMTRTPIVVNDNLIDFVVTPSSLNKPATVTAHPTADSYHVDAYVNTVAADKQLDISLKASGENKIVLRGEIPLGNKPVIVVIRPKDPSIFARSLLIKALKHHGVETEASALDDNPENLLPDSSSYKNLKQVALFVSPPFSETAKLILKVSHNLGANLMPMQIAAHEGKTSYEEGLMLEGQILQQLGVDMHKVSLSDGQGADPSDLLSPDATVQLLTAMSKTPYFKAYFNAMPILGVDGTLATAVEQNNPVRGQVFAKTGTIILGDATNNRNILIAKGMAGYIISKNGHRLAFAIFINHAPINSVEQGVLVGNVLGDIAAVIYQNS
jgi:D-alanyl-D-alanine carboxypeptidase/D-alanyl-D-alanine-endopeptidase (penicillin-binding protein 4)